MNIKYCPINHRDQRGAIMDIFPSGAPDSVTLITCAPGAIRGNHVHAQSTQWLFVISGMIYAYARKPGLDLERWPNGRIEREVLHPGALLCHNPGEEHAYESPVSSVFLAFAHGLRKGDDYERDTRRVPSLIEAWAEQASAR